MLDNIWLSAANSFNDLYDTTALVNTARGVEALIERGLRDGTIDLPNLKQFLPPVSRGFIEAFDALLHPEVERLVGNPAADRARDFIATFCARMSAEQSTKMSEFLQRATKVGCFCEAGDVPQMWGYYTNHEGFCLEYPLESLPDDDLRLRWLVPVVYRAERFSLTEFMLKLDGHKSPYAAWLSSIHKAPSWAHEREWRIVDTVGDDAPGREISMPTPSRLIMGHRIKSADRSAVIDIARHRGIPVFQAAPSSDGYVLTLNPVLPAQQASR
jgi:hypothetical protein